MPIKAIVDGFEKDITRIPILADSVYKDTLEVRDNQDRLLWYREDTLTETGVSSISFRGYGIPLKSVKIVGNGAQNGTPSPDNIIMPTFCGNLVGSDWTIPITCAGQTVPVYLGQVSTVRRIRKLVLAGDESWTYTESGTKKRVYLRGFDTAIAQIPLCTHFTGTDFVSYPDNGYFTLNAISATQSLIFGVSNMGITSESDWTTYLAAQYAAGNPVTVWYVLATPETAIVNEPLAKIGNYVDELVIDPNITPQTGTNTLTIDTTLSPSSVSITGHIKAIGQ